MEKKNKNGKSVNEKNNETVMETDETAEVSEDKKEDIENNNDGSVTMTKEEFETAQQMIKKLQDEAEEYKNDVQRIQAEFMNYKRRNATAQADSFDDGERNVIKELLPVIDNFDRALENKEGADENWIKGIELVRKQLLETLQKLGLEEVEAEGKFNPNTHNAVMQEAVEGTESGTILAVFQKGYKVKDRIIRHSMVKVAE